jgi:hypothetical protein
LALEAALKRKDQGLALKDKDILAVVATLRSKDETNAVLEAARQAAETARVDARDLVIEKELVTKQENFLTAWQNKFDELADIAQKPAVDGAMIKRIRDRS